MAAPGRWKSCAPRQGELPAFVEDAGDPHDQPLCGRHQADCRAGFAGRGMAVALSLDDVNRVFEANVIGSLALTQSVVPHMARRGSGRIVNVGNVVGVLPTVSLSRTRRSRAWMAAPWCPDPLHPPGKPIENAFAEFSLSGHMASGVR